MLAARPRQSAPASGGATRRGAERRGRLVSRRVSAGGWQLHARVSAEPLPAGAPAVVLLHGLLVSSRYMVPTAERLAPYCRVHAPDLPGYGKSAKPPHALDLPAQANALAAYLDAAGLGRVALVANSYGCQIAVEFAVRYPERLTHLVLVGLTVDPGMRTPVQVAAHWLLNVPVEPPALGLVLLRDFADMGPRRLLETFLLMLADRIERKLPLVDVPTLVVRGGRDPLVTQRWAETATRLLPNGRLVVVDGAAHSVNYNSPRALARLVRVFVGAWAPLPGARRAGTSAG